MRLVSLLPVLALAAAGCGTATGATIDDPLAAPAASASFEPSALLVEDPNDTWYMSRAGFENRIQDVEGLCAWAGQQPDLHDAINDVLAEAGSPLSDGLPVVVADVCGDGEHVDGAPLPAGTSTLWAEYRVDCFRYAAKWRGQEWEQSNPTAECMNGRFGPTVLPEEWASPEAVEKYRPEVYAEAFPDDASTSSPSAP